MARSQNRSILSTEDDLHRSRNRGGEPLTRPSSTSKFAKTISKQRLKSALWYTIGQLTDTTLLESNDGGDNNATPQFIGALTELVHAKISTSATDMEAFAKHAGRNTINATDVALLARHNEALQDVLKDKADAVRNN